MQGTKSVIFQSPKYPTFQSLFVFVSQETNEINFKKTEIDLCTQKFSCIWN